MGLTEILDLRNNEIEFIEEGTFDNLPNLKELNLLNNSIPAEHLFSFGNHSNLEILELGNIRDSEFLLSNSTIGIRNFYPNLKSLHLEKVGANKILTQNFNTVVPKLEELYLIKNKGMDNIQIAELSHLKGLWIVGSDFRSLILTDRLEACKWKQQICIGPMSDLRTLCLHDCNISVLSIQFFIQASLPNLSGLTLTKNKLKTVSLLVDASVLVPKFQSLETLILDGGDLGCSIQTIICTFSNLRELLAQNMAGEFNEILNRNFTDRCSSNLERLYLNDNNLKTIPGNLLQNVKNLELLDLSNNKLTKFSLTTDNLSLKALRLKSNLIKCGDNCSNVIKTDNLKRLECLDIRENEIDIELTSYLKPFINSTDEMCNSCFGDSV